jgi:hypothetical protein
MPTKLVKIGRRAFKGCTSLDNIILPIGTKSIGLDAFADCTALRRIALPKELSDIEDEDAFGGCDNLTDISFGGTKEAWEMMLHGKTLTLQRSDLTVATPKVAFMNL